MDTHTSYSRVSAYLRCGLAYKFKYLMGLEQEFQPAPLIFGVAIHRAVELFFRSKMTGKSAPTLNELYSTFQLAWEDQAKNSPEIRFKEGEDAHTQSDLAKRMLAAFLDYTADRVFNVLAVEQRFSVALTPGMPPLVAFVDLIEGLPNGGEICITDIKTAAKRYSETSAFDSLQLAAYAAIAKALGHEGVVQVKYLVITKAKVPAIQTLAAVLDDPDIHRFVKIAQAVHDAAEKEAFVPNPGWQCGSCQWQGACREEMSRAA